MNHVPAGREPFAPLKFLRALCACTVMASGVLSAADQPAADKAPSSRMAKRGDLVFSLLPKSMQKNPFLDMTYNTELTPHGRTMRQASADHPVYYVVQSAGYRQLGWTVGGELLPKTEEIDQTLAKALAANGFLPAKLPRHPPELLIVFYWGSHNKPDDETAQNFPELARKNALERALLIGGKTFADNASFTMQWGGSQTANAEKMNFLLEQADDEIYFIVASAYDYRAMARKEGRKLVWRTTMTVASPGLALAETLRPLIVSGAQFIGRETAEPEVGSRRGLRETNVQLGEIMILKSDVPAFEQPDAKPTK